LIGTSSELLLVTPLEGKDDWVFVPSGAIKKLGAVRRRGDGGAEWSANFKLDSDGDC